MLASDNQEGIRSYADMVTACRETWAGDSVFGVYGHSKRMNLQNEAPDSYYLRQEDSTIFVNTPDARDNLLKKTIKGMECLLNNFEFDYLFRPNCGSYINLKLLSEFLEDKPRHAYYGGINGHYANTGYYASGSCILMSRDVVEILVEDQGKLEYNGNVLMDDVSIGRHLINVRGIELDKNAIRKNCRSETDIEREFDPNCYHYYFCHTINPALIYKCHQMSLDIGNE
jgi:hypothetical protein